MFQTIKLALVISSIASLSACGGGGGGGGGGNNGATSGCSPESNTNFYEVTGSGCTNPISNNLKTTLDITSSYGFADGGGSGGDGGGGGGGGGDGGDGGAGAGDAFIRLAKGIQSIFYALTGTGNAFAQSISACGTGVSQSDLNKLTATGWQYQPMVKSATPSGTACVKRIYDANKYLAVYATGLTRNDQICYLVLVSKTDGRSRCFSSSKSMSLADDFDYANYYSEYITNDGSTSAVVNSANGTYLGVMLRSRNTGGAGSSYFLARLTVDSNQALTSKLIFEGDSFFPRAEISTGSPVFNTFAITNSGGGYLNFYKNVAGDPLRQREIVTTQTLSQGAISKQRIIHYEIKSDGSGSDQTGYTYYTNGITAPVILNNNIYSNPQCWIQISDTSESYLAVMKKNSTGFYDLIKFDAGNSIQTKINDTDICLASNSKAILKSDGKLFYYQLTKDSSLYSGAYFAKVKYVDLVSPNTVHDVLDLPPPLNINCNTNSVSADLFEASIYFDSNERLIVAARSEPTFQTNGTITSGGLSIVKVYDENLSSVNTISYSDCKFVRKFEKSGMGNFAYITEPYQSSQILNLIQTTKTLNSSFVETFTNDKAGQNFKIGGTLLPM